MRCSRKSSRESSEPVVAAVLVGEQPHHGRVVGGEPVDLTGSVLVFVAEAGPIRLVKSTADGTLAMPAPTTGELMLSLTPAETRLLPVGRLKTRYEIECRIGTEETTLVSGCITVMDGINDDSGDH